MLRIRGLRGALTEYDSYAPAIVSLLVRGCSADDLERHLSRIETESMGLSPRSAAERATTVVHLLALREETMPTSTDELGFDLVGPGPPSPKGWERSPNLAYQCDRCDTFMPADFNDYFSCACGAMTLDFDAGRFGSRFGDQAIRTYRRAK